MPTPAIELRNVSRHFGQVKSLDGLSLEIEPGCVFGYLGPNGAGKTTTLRVLLGLVRPDGGEVRVLGLDPRTQGHEVRTALGVLLENDGLYDRLTAWQNLELYARIRRIDGADRARRLEEMLRACGLWERRADRVVTFSKGMRQKLAVARALLHRPRLVLLDEPFSGLDPVAAADLRANIVSLAREHGITVLLTTHDLAHVEKSCDRVAVLRAGRVIAAGTIEELRSGGRDEEVGVAGLGLTEAVLAEMKEAGTLLTYALDPARSPPWARVTCAKSERPRLGTELVRRGVALEELTTLRASLEETFLALVGDGKEAAS
ncbi:MAG TPA: ABC transporter ATP-binding protein [Polyangiaceae bacterium]|jgi:ABC-2 type transport system ATP-binding protein